MDEITITDLRPLYDHAKSFYGKAQIIDHHNGHIELRSYNTIVCSVTNGANYKRLWNGHSLTTTRHIKEFCHQFAHDPDCYKRK